MNLDASREKDEVLAEVKAWMTEEGFRIVDDNETKPWGAYYVIDPDQVEKFIQRFFAGRAFSEEELQLKLDGKILVVAPYKRLSWQYHYRRAELWRVVEGPVEVVISPEDAETTPQLYQSEELIEIQQGERHRLIGAGNWGVVAEIWQHTDPTNPSEEEDIVRLQDDFGREEPVETSEA